MDQDDQRKTRSEDSRWSNKVATCRTGRIWPRMIREKQGVKILDGVTKWLHVGLAGYGTG